jgi:hypothetical protein
MVRNSGTTRRRSEDSGMAVAAFVILTIGVAILIWFVFFRKCDADPYVASGSVHSSIPSEKVTPPEQKMPAQMPASAAPASVDTSALTHTKTDSVMATAPQRAAAYQAAVNADFGPDSGPLSVAAIASRPTSNPDYAFLLSAEPGSLGDAARKMLATAGPASSAPETDDSSPGSVADALAVFPKNVGMSALQANKQEEMMKMPQTETWKMSKEQEDAKRSENSLRAALAAADPMRAAEITASMGPLNPITLRGALAAQRSAIAVRSESSRLGVSSHVAGPTLAVRMGIVAPAAMPVVTGEGLTNSTQIQETVARFNRNIASEAAKCAPR